MLKIKLTKKEVNELRKLRRRSNDYRSERALCILLNADGHSAVEISKQQKRSYFTVRNWLLSFKENRIDGLNRTYSPGRPSDIRKQLVALMKVWFNESPGKYGFIQNCWTVKLIARMFKIKTEKIISENTVERALKDSGFSYKRPKKRVAVNAPSKEEKLQIINSIINKIKEIFEEEDAEVFSIDESHFSNEPYVIKGWYIKKENVFSLLTPKKRQGCTIFGALNLKTKSFYWKSSQKGNAESFIEFIHQLKLNIKKKKIFLILDNVSYHKCKKLKAFEGKYKNLIFKFLSTYSPEYNPAEQVWIWSKKIIGQMKIPFNNIAELISYFRKIVWHNRNRNIGNNINIGIGIWNNIFVDI